MNKKTKLVATIMAMCLVITLGVIGIFAVKTLNMSVGGNITFSADGLSLEVSAGIFKDDKDAKYEGITTQTGKMQAFAINTDTKLSDVQSKIDSWAGLELSLDSKGDAVLHFSVTNKMTTPLYVYVSTTLGENTNDNMDLIVSPNGTEIGAGATTNFAITFDILDTSINAGLKGFEVAMDFDKEEKVLKTQYKIDEETGLATTEIDYYYVEMGTYNGQPVKWRYIANSDGTRYEGTSVVNSLSGYYVLETDINKSMAFLDASKYNSSTGKHLSSGYTNINANDYGLSDVRAFLTGNGTSDFCGLLGISQDDVIYSQIIGRTVADLYSNIITNGEAIDKSVAKHSLSLTGDKSIADEVDKLWLMSSYEASSMFENDGARVWGLEGTYWMRTPSSPAGGAAFVVYKIGLEGLTNSNSMASAVSRIRPCFKIG